ncbi:hypothetical protein [Novosphingobium rosa]|uniref:hypothetical protein n=1 Tax=Novosphingobium rosa TaxID=76978 RepID=UPI0008339EC9|nr:hypothetical protein [Novosphingobium rosa]
MPVGTIRVPSNQPLGLLAAALLEAEAPDSFLAQNAAIRAAFDSRLAANPAFAQAPKARLDWLMERLPDRSPFHLIYPIRRET